MSSRGSTQTVERLNALRSLLLAGKASTQEELVSELSQQKFAVTQSTISRDLSRLGAIRMRDKSGQIVYRLPDSTIDSTSSSTEVKSLVVSVEHNSAMIVVKTTPGSASLVAHHLDKSRPAGILGTIAGDDTVFVAPRNIKKIEETVRDILVDLDSF